MITHSVQTGQRVDPAAFVEAHQRGVMRWLLALGCEWARAEEHCQDALLAGLARDVATLPRARAAAWLRTAATNLFRMELRAQRRRPRQRDFDEVEAAWRAARADEDGADAALDALRGCVAALAERDRAVIDQRYWHGRSRDAMATALGVSGAGVKMALRRARLKLRACVEAKLNQRGAS